MGQGIEAISNKITLMLACEKWVKSTGNCLICMVSSGVTLCDPMDYSLPGSSVHGISQARILEQVSISFSRGSSQPTDGTQVSYASFIGRRILYC